MKNLVLLISILTINSAIRVPNNWNDVHSASVTVAPLTPRGAGGSPYIHHYYPINSRRIKTNVPPEDFNSAWSPGLVKRSTSKPNFNQLKPKYYKKPTHQFQKKKRFSKPGKIGFNYYDNKVPYITHKKSNNLDTSVLFPPRPLSTFANVYPQVKARPNNIQPLKIQSINQNTQFKQIPNLIKSPENIPIIRPMLQQTNYFNPFKINSNLDSKHVQSFEQPRYQSNNPNSYEPNKSIINYFEAVKNEDFTPIQPHWGDKITYGKVKEPTYENNYQAYHNPQKNEIEYTPKENDPRYYTHLYKNYRDDETFEPEKKDKHYIKEEDPKFDREEVEKPPVSSHEIPKEIPTRPIYPGEGLWATPGLQHRPFISQQIYETLKEDEVKPKGYETFIQGQNLFNSTGQNLIHRFRAFPEQHKLGSFIQDKPTDPSNSETKETETAEKELIENKEENKSNGGEEEESEEDEFVPTRLYSQVRATEDKEYLPLEEADDGKLREAIKESKIHTVYTEEGYEDSAYDHAGHEKEAENDEGFEDLQREKQEKKEKLVPKAKLNLHLPNVEKTKFSYGGNLPSDEEIARLKEAHLGISDTDSAGTHFEEPYQQNDEDEESDDTQEKDDIDDYEDESASSELSTKPKQNVNNFMSTKETKTMTTKQKDDGDTETEISSKVKIILQPNNSTKSQEYVKIYPKVYKTIRRKKPTEDIEADDEDKSEEFSENVYPTEQNRAVNFSEIFIEEIIPTTEIPFTKLPPTEFEDLQEEIPITTLPTTAIPKPIKSNNDFPKNADEALDNISKEFLKSNKRIKRFTNDLSDLKIDNEFVPKISHQLGKIFDYKKIKYPYYDNYKEEGLNIDSPLRYSENMKNMPNKTGKKMVFYEQAEKIKPCPEIEATLNPIPEKVLNEEKNKHEVLNESEEEEDENENVNEENVDETQENEEENQINKESRKKRDVSKQPKTSRLSGLGDQIDCLKVRYFGENPLDSPFFDEVTVGTIEPIFKELNKANKIRNHFKTKRQKNLNDKLKNKLQENNSEDKLSKTEVDTGIKTIKKTENTVQITTESNQETTTSISLLTTPYYTIDLKPKHIYDQIELLEYLPNHEVLNNKSATKEVQNNSNVNSRRDKSLDDDNLDSQSSINSPVLPEPEELIRRRKIRRRKPAFQIFDVNKFLPTTPPPIIRHPIGHGAFKAADNGAYMTAIHIPFKPATSAILEPATPKPPAFNAIKKLPGLQIFDFNKFVPTTPSIYKEIITSSTVLPKYKVISEVFYKDDIKPNEQLNVFTDILNNIKNSSQNETQLQDIDTADEPSEPVIVTVNKQTIDYSKKRRTPQYYQDSYLKAYGDQEIESDYTDPIATTARTTTTTTTLRPTTYRGRYGYKIRTSPLKTVPVKNSIDSYEQKLKLYVALQEAKKKQNYAHINNNPDYDHTIPVNEDIYDYVDKTTKVMGLMPPGTNRYKTIHHPKRDNAMQISNPSHNQIIRKVNKFYVPGMKPPPHQRVLLYSDYLNNNLLEKKVSIRRGKRSTDRGAYASLSRNRGKQESELENVTVPDIDDDDYYVPHRSKNYYFDEKTGKIVYLTTKKPKVVEEEEEEEEEIEYEEIIEETPSTSSKPKPKQDPIFATATPPPEGKGYLDFILKLKQNPNYTFIPDPTTTEKGIELVTNKTVTTTLKPQSTTPPEFLNILSKVRQNNRYKLIEDKKEPIKKPTTPDPEEILEDDDELEDEDFSSGNIQNSPGGFINHETTENFGIFDVTEFIPKIKNYLPRTSYDTSKYKSISRPTTKPTAADEEEEEDENQSEEQHQSQIRHPPHKNIVQEYNTEEPTTERIFVIITEDTNHKLDSLNEATVTKQTEQIPVTLKRRRSTTTTSTTSSTHSTEPTEKPTTRATFLRRRRPTTLRSGRTTTSRPFTSRAPPTTSVSVSHEEKIRRVFRRRPPTKTSSSTTKYLDEVEDDKNIKVLRRRSGTVQQSSTESPTTPKSNRFIETFKKFHRNKKHGGNYRRDNSPNEQSRISKKIEPSLGEISEAPLNKGVEVIGEYDKTKRHGGNYRKLEGNEELIEETEDNSQDYEIEDVTDTSNGNSLRISLLPKQEDNQELEERVENGGNDDDDDEDEHLPEKKEEEESEKRNKAVAINKKKSDKNSKGKYVTEATLSRLTDVVPKPEAFYSDPTLPKSVNNLALANRPSSAEIKDILNNADSSEINVNRQESSTTKHPLIIKDPSKRFYFYAPI